MTTMGAVDVHEAKTHLSRLIARAAQGEEITITKAGRSVARLVGIRTPPRSRPLGTARGKVRIADDFKAPLPREFRQDLGN